METKVAETASGPQQEYASEMTSRTWSKAERRVVLRGSLGRMTIAIEPLIVGLFFLILPIGLLWRGQEIAHLVAPIFALGAIAFITYAIVLATPCIRASFETLLPIYTVNGYIRYREDGGAYYVAVLNADRHVLGEWPMKGSSPVAGGGLYPAVVEFSRYGGIHKIDGRPTGVLPTEISALGVGIAQDLERRAVQL
jgi:hypothetical protein